MVKLTEALVRFGYRLTMGADPVAVRFSRVFFRHYCPYPVIADCRASACIKAGHCGCDNSPRIALQQDER